jgi:putative protease
MNSETTIPAVTAAPKRSLRLPELLAPAGDWECAKAAVENGADAIYFGLERFNARMRAHNFSAADLPGLMEFLHRRGVKGYVTFNTLIFQNEWSEAEDFARTIISAGVDAAIVQDIGICRLLRRLSPDFPIHASTQMTVTSAQGVEFARELGCNLVVLARECSLKEIEQISGAAAAREGTGTAAGATANAAAQGSTSLPLEVFVHGALCVAYSGQCLTSEALGGRSANRGECAQACRLPYELISDGERVTLGDRQYLLSPQDLAGLEITGDLVKAGVSSLKIEGRLKSPEYVANITRVYRQALDSLVENSSAKQIRADSCQATSSEPKTPSGASDAASNSQYDIEMAFSRGLYTGWFRGINNQQLVHARFGKKRGVYLGEVSRVERGRVSLKLQGPLKPGDGVVFDAGHPEQREEGGRLYEMKSGPTGETWLAFGHRDIDFGQVHVGDKLWKTSDPELDRRLRQTFEGDAPKFHRPVRMETHGRVGGPLTLIVRDELGHVVRMDSAMPLVQAEKQPLSTERLRAQLGRLGGTPFQLGQFENFLEGAPLLPISELNRLRREAASQLEARRAEPKRWTLLDPRDSGHAQRAPGAKPAQLIVLSRNLAQLEAVLAAGVETVYCEFEDPKKYREAVRLVRAVPPVAKARPSEIFVAPPRIFKMGEEWILKQVRSCDADGYLIRNYDHLRFFANDRRVGDYSLNIANHLAAEYFKEQFCLERITASYDLNATQLEALLRSAPPEWFEVTIHQHMPMFHMEHCVFCAFLSRGTDYTNCGRPCDRHDVKLRDRVGAEHPIKADVGCRNTVFNSLAQTGADYVAGLLDIGVRNFRLEFLNETPVQVTDTIARYRALLRGEITGPQVWRELKLLNQLGVTRGQMAGKKG